MARVKELRRLPGTGDPPGTDDALERRLPFRRALLVLAAGGSNNAMVTNLAFLLGAGAVLASGLIHLHLWMTGYREITTIGNLFLAQSVAAFVLAPPLLIFRRLWLALVGAGYLAATVAGFLVSVNVGLFGFQDSWSASFAGSAFAIELGGTVVLLATSIAVTLAVVTRRERTSRL